MINIGYQIVQIRQFTRILFFCIYIYTLAHTRGVKGKKIIGIGGENKMVLKLVSIYIYAEQIKFWHFFLSII